MATKIKATYRNSRAACANHNTLKEMREGQSHINAADIGRNVYYKFNINGKAIRVFDSYNSKDHELSIYRKLYGQGLDAQNERHKAKGNHKRVKTIEDIYSHKNTSPMETILQIGNSKIPEAELSTEDKAKKLWSAAAGLVKDLQKKYGSHITFLDMSLHMEELVPHIHLRYTFHSQDRYGFDMPQQTKALEELGFERPDPTKKTSRYNNPLISFTDALRERFYRLCERQGLQIDREVENPSQRHEDRCRSRVKHLVQLYEALMAPLFQEAEQSLKNEFIDTYTVNSSKGYKKPIRDFYLDYVKDRLATIGQTQPELRPAIEDFRDFFNIEPLEDPEEDNGDYAPILGDDD